MALALTGGGSRRRRCAYTRDSGSFSVTRLNMPARKRQPSVVCRAHADSYVQVVPGHALCLAPLGPTPWASLTLPPRYALLTVSSLTLTGLTVLGEIANETSTVELALGTAHWFVSEERLQHLIAFLHKHLFLGRRSAVKTAELIDSETLE